jgi:hypothetical protein
MAMSVAIGGALGECVLDDVRFASKTDIASCNLDVRFTPKSGHCWATARCPLSANSGHSRSLGERGNGGFRDLLAPLLNEVTAV